MLDPNGVASTPCGFGEGETLGVKISQDGVDRGGEECFVARKTGSQKVEWFLGQTGPQGCFPPDTVDR